MHKSQVYLRKSLLCKLLYLLFRDPTKTQEHLEFLFSANEDVQQYLSQVC